MTAPLHISSGAPVAQKLCATAEIAPKINLAAQKRATAPSAVEQQRSKLDFSIRAIPPQQLHAATQQNGKDSLMESKTTEELVEVFKEINDELYRRGENPASVLQKHIRSRTVRAPDGRMRLSSEVPA